MKISVLIISVLFFVISSLNAQPKDSCYGSLDSGDFYLLTETEEVLIIDTRSLKEFETERIENAYLAADRRALEKLLENESRDIAIVLYCDEGKRSKGAAEILCSELKFSRVYNLKGGISRWKKDGYPVFKD